MVLFDLFGPFPRLLGWLWYLLVSFTGILTHSTHTALNLTRIFLIKKVVLSPTSNLLVFSLQISKT